MRMSRLLSNITNLLKHFELFIQNAFPQIGPTYPGWAMVGNSCHLNKPTDSKEFSLSQLLGDGILWAVPKHRRTIEKRLKRKFGIPEYNWKPLRLKTHLRNCIQCGHDFEAGALCPHCYRKVRAETEQMQEKIQENLGLQPIEQEVIVLYEGERKEHSLEDLQNKRIIEMPKSRPMWFSKNLLQRSTQQPSDEKQIKPNNLA